jgi:hypothetical protein
MAYTRVWKRNEDGTIEGLIIPERRYLEVECRLHREMIPQWLTKEPMIEDFDIWAESIPRIETHKFLETYDRINEDPIIEILEREGAIEKESYKRPSGGYGSARTHSSNIQENSDSHDLRTKNGKAAWCFPITDSSSDRAWYAPDRPASVTSQRRKRNVKGISSEDGMLSNVPLLR